MFGLFKTARPRAKRTSLSRKPYLCLREQARSVIMARLEHYGSTYGYSWNRVAIRDQRRRWGSCSSLGNLNFNYRLIFLPDCLRDYIIIHELCHLKQLNHGPAFWAAVAQHCPDYKESVRILRDIERKSRLKEEILLKFKETHSCGYCSLQQSFK